MLGAAALVLAACIVLWLVSVGGEDAARAVAYLGGSACAVLAVSVAVGRFEGVAAALAVLGGGYAVILVVDDPPLDGRSAFVGAALLTIGELSHLSISTRSAGARETGGAARRVAWIAVLALLAITLGGVVLAVADVLRTRGIAIEALGVAAAVAAVGLLALAARDATRDAG